MSFFSTLLYHLFLYAALAGCIVLTLFAVLLVMVLSGAGVVARDAKAWGRRVMPKKLVPAPGLPAPVLPVVVPVAVAVAVPVVPL